MSGSGWEPDEDAPQDRGASTDRARDDRVERDLGTHSTEGPVPEPVLLVPPAPSTGSGPRPVLTEASVPPARHGRLARHATWRTLAKFFGAVVTVLALGAAAIAGFAVIDVVREIKPPVRLESEEVLERVPDIGAMEGGLNFLLVGSDERPPSCAFGYPEIDSATLNDVTMLIHISEDHSHVEVISFPRDMLVDVPACPNPSDPAAGGYGERYGVKLNTLLKDGGFACIASTIERMLGITIPVGGIVEFDGVAALAEAVGGVEVCLVDPVNDPRSGLNLPAGTHSITGYQALAFLRTRHGVGDGSDLGRISVQQTFLASLARTVQSDGTLGNPVKLYSMAKAVLANMTLSQGLRDPVRLVSVARALQDIDLEKIAFIQYPTAYTWDFSAVEPTASANVIASALQRDVPVTFNPIATGSAPFGTVEAPTPSATPPPTPAPSIPPSPGATPPPTGTTPPAPAAEALPGDVTGMTAAETRCATANRG